MKYNQDKVAVVAGSTGTAGRTLVDYLSQQEDHWTIICLARNTDDLQGISDRVIPVQADLMDRASLHQALSNYKVTHLFYTAWFKPKAKHTQAGGPILDPRKMKQKIAFVNKWIIPLFAYSKRLQNRLYRSMSEQAGLLDPDNRNLMMLTNIVETLAQPPSQLKHVALLTGGRYYGMHLGPAIYPNYQIPFTEDMDCSPGPSAYIGMEDYVQKRAGNAFSWSIIRPTFIIGRSSRPMQNIGYAIGIYAWLLKEMGKPLIFPGGLDSYTVKGQFSDGGLLSSMLTWSADTPDAANNVFNLVNGDTVSWEEIWPQLGAYFGMPIAAPANGIDFNDLLAERHAVWDRLRCKYQLPDLPLESVFSAQFLASSMVINWDVEYSMEKARRFGFVQSIKTEQMFADLFECMAADKIIPPKPPA